MIEFTAITKNENGTWTLTWASTGAASYRVILNGKLFANTTALSYVSTLSGYDQFPPPFEIVDVGDVALSEYHIPYLRMQWYAVAGARSYVVQRKIAAVWTDQHFLSATGRWVYTVRSPLLADEMQHLFRVLSVDALENRSVALDYKIDVVRPPIVDEASFDVSYDQTAEDVVIAESA